MTLPFGLNSWRALWQIFWHRKWLLGLVLFLCLGAGLLIAMLTPPEFESVATIMYLDTDILAGSTLRFVPAYPQREELEVFRRRISSQELLFKTLDSLSLQQDPKVLAQIQQLEIQHPEVDRAEIARQVYLEVLRKRITTRMAAYNLIEIQATGSTAKEAYRLARALTNLAIGESRINQVKSIEAASSFSNQQAEVYRKRLAEAEEKLFRFNRGLVDAQLNNTELSIEKMQELQALLLSNDIELQSKQLQFEEKNVTLKFITAPQRRELDRSLADLKVKLSDRIDDLNRLSKKFTWRDMEVIQLNEQIASLKKQYKDQLHANLSQIYTGSNSSYLPDAERAEYLSLEISLLEQSRSSLDKIIKEHNDQLRSQPTKESTKDRLERDVRVNREIYELLAQQARGSQIRESVQETEGQLKYKVISPPTQPLERIKPNRRRIMMVAAFIGLSLAIGIVLGLESMDASIRRVEDVPQFLGVPVLAIIPKIRPETPKGRPFNIRLGSG
jgi:uncharacterized protein involved in exopolysaccharide biosynthesis